jgi:predicted nucleic acid-binding protein
MYLLDTNVVSEFRKESTGKSDRRVGAWARSVPATSLFLSAVTVSELELGTLQMERRDALQGALLRSWMESHVLPAFAGRVLPVDTPVALRCAALHVPNPRSYRGPQRQVFVDGVVYRGPQRQVFVDGVVYRDALIAATALVHGMTVVTRNVADFAPTGVAVLNPWQP